MEETSTPPSHSSTSVETTKRKVAHSDEFGFSDQVRVPNVIVMVGLPARGKTYISKKLCRYLKWTGFSTRVFNVGEYRRTDATAADAVHGANASFFSPDNADALRVRAESARRAMEDMANYLETNIGSVAIFDATNTTKQRRQTIIKFCEKKRFRCFFIESVCDDQRIIDSNVTDVKINSPDYKGLMTADQAKDDFMRRIENYQRQYEPLEEDETKDGLSFIKVINAGRSFKVHQVRGHVQSRVVYFLMNIHLLPRSIYVTRHGESEYNSMNRIGGDSPLTENGQKYADALSEFFVIEDVPGLRVWCSQKVRAAQTAQNLHTGMHTEYWKALDEIDAGICEGLTYEDIKQRYPKQAEDRLRDKYHYRYPSGESYEDVVARLEPVIMELERQANICVVSHQAVIRCILAYFFDRSLMDLPSIEVPLHALIKITPRAYHCDLTLFKYDTETNEWSKECKQLQLESD